MLTGEWDGADRDYFFPVRGTAGLRPSSLPPLAVAPFHRRAAVRAHTPAALVHHGCGRPARKSRMPCACWLRTFSGSPTMGPLSIQAPVL